MLNERRPAAPEHAKLVPVAIDPERDRVDLLDMRGVEYREPFFHETVKRWRCEAADSFGTAVNIATFKQAARHHRKQPGAFIFHLGRCGSTLLSNLLAATGRHVLIKEPRPVSDLIAAWLTTDEPPARRELEVLISAAARYLAGTAGNGRYKVLKFAAWNVRMAGTLMNLFPETAAVFVYRSPLDVVASLMFQPPAWGDLIYCRRKLQCCFFPSLAEVPENEPLSPPLLFAHAWKSCAEAALTQPAGRLMLVEYQEIVSNPTCTVERLLVHFKHKVNASSLSKVAGAGMTYSKDSLGRVTFDPRGTHRRPSLSASDEAQVRDVTASTVSRLQDCTPPHPPAISARNIQP
jgi:hypothetical protein